LEVLSATQREENAVKIDAGYVFELVDCQVIGQRRQTRESRTCLPNNTLEVDLGRRLILLHISSPL
jgi:hypothetical protein